MRILQKRPGRDWEIVNVPNTLEALQELVGGYIEVLSLWNDAALVCNEEGLIKALPYNCNLLGHAFFGNVLLVGVDGEEFTDLKNAEEVRLMI